LKTKGIYFLYRVLQALALPPLLGYFLFRSVRDSAYSNSLGQRLGFLPASFKQTVPGAIWLHAVSVGEVVTVVELARRLRVQFPHAPLFLSVGTLAGHAAAREKLADIATGLFYAPIDHVFVIRRVLRALQPAIVVILETEIWPNLFREVKRAGCGLLIVNGRISDRTEARYRRLRWFFREVLRWPDAVLAQTEPIRERYLAMGAPPEHITIGGNLKYDFLPREAAAGSPVRRFIDGLRPAEVWIAASTMPPASSGDIDEDDAVLAAFRELAPKHLRLLLVLVPRKPERFDVAAAKLTAAGIAFVRRSQIEMPLELPGVLLLDSIGELSGLFPLADAVFMGGTLAGRGGHNILEPAFFARPVICGPHMENFRQIAQEFRERQAYVEIASASRLAGAVDQLLTDPAWAAKIGQRALECAQSNRGATERAMDVIREAAMRACPQVRPALAALVFLWPLAWIWRSVGARNRRRNMRSRRKLDTAVISVGNITMGGTGKTPLVLYLAECMKHAGRRPGILTRGYGRHSLDKRLILEPGTHVKTAQTGDEPQMFLRSGIAPLGIGADRFETGRQLYQRFGTDVLILDDGFQHVHLARQVDIVLIDALSPFGGGDVFPLGRLREPLESLSRADAFVITRSDCAPGTWNIERALRRNNAHAPVFRARTVPEHWVDAASGLHIPARELPVSRAAAFCGLGNPESFWNMLDQLGIEIADRIAFDDHHAYRASEMRRLARQFLAERAEAALTTEKDAINFCEGGTALMAPLPVYWLKIRVEIDREAEFLAFVVSRLGSTTDDRQVRHASE
jgi:3-deoxy-D-manno-octulosonic-acid transferase